MKTTPLLLSTLLLATLIAPCRAGMISDPLGLQNGTLQYLAAPGAVNTVTLTVQNSRLILRDTTAPLPPANIPGALRPNPNTLSLPVAAVQRVRVVLGDRNDSLHAGGLIIPLNIAGGPGTDTIVGSEGADSLHGNDGDDTLWGGGGTDEICGGNGNDSLTGDDGDDIICGGGDADILAGGNGNDTLHGDDDSDTLQGDDGDDTLHGGASTDEICGGNGNDSLTGDPADSGLYGSNANGLMGTDGNDVVIVVFPDICGGADDDQLILPPLHGGQGQDTLSIQGRRISPALEAALSQTLPSMHSIEILDIAGE